MKVLLKKRTDGIPYDPLPDIDAIATFDLTSQDISDIKKIESFMEHVE